MLLKMFKYYVVKVYYHFYALDNRRLLIIYSLLLIPHYLLLITYYLLLIPHSLSLLALFITFSLYIYFECINNIIETMVGIVFLFRELYVAPTKLFPI